MRAKRNTRTRAIGSLAVILALAASLAIASPTAAKPSHGWDVRCGRSLDTDQIEVVTRLARRYDHR